MQRLVAVTVCAVGCGRVGFAPLPDSAAIDAIMADAPDVVPIVAAGDFTQDVSEIVRTLASAQSRTTFTLATWYRSSNVATMLFCAGAAADRQTFLWAGTTTGTPLLQHQESGTGYAAAPALGNWPYLGQWAHLVLAVDVTQATPELRARWWVNGVPQVIETGGAMALPQDLVMYFGAASLHTFGNKYDGAFDWTGALADTYLIWGHALDASRFVAITPDGPRSVRYTGPITPESVHFEYAPPGSNSFTSEPDWIATSVTSTTTDLPY